MSFTLPDSDRPIRLLSFIGIALTTIACCAVLGGMTNAINGWVSPTYFVRILGWSVAEDIWRMSIAQGILEGLLFGVLFSMLFTGGVGIITRVSSSYRFAVRHLAGISACALACWVLGGIAGMGLASLSPDFYRRQFFGVPDEFEPMLRYAWVGGSIWGLQLGGLMTVVLGLIIFRANWRRSQGTSETPRRSNATPAEFLTPES